MTMMMKKNSFTPFHNPTNKELKGNILVKPKKSMLGNVNKEAFSLTMRVGNWLIYLSNEFVWLVVW